MTALELGTCLIRVFEGLRLTSYQDSGGIWTIGLGRTAGVQPGQVITYEQAVEFAQSDMAPLLALVEGKPLLVAGALLSFGYNCGYTSLKHVLAGTAKLEEFVHDHRGNLLPGLVARRELESALLEAGGGLSAS